MTLNRNVQQRQFSRLWLIEFGAGPNNAPSYESLWRAGAASFPQGDVTAIRAPDPRRYGHFQVIGRIRGEPGLPTLPVTAYYLSDRQSTLLKLARNGCVHDLQVHMGLCQDPQNFNAGWSKIAVLEKATPTTYGTTDLGSLMASEQEVVNEEVPFTGESYYEILPVQFAEQAASQIVQEIVDVRVCDTIVCGECGIPSNGCDVVLGLTLTAGGSPGLAAEVIYSQDGGATWADTLIDTLAANQDPNAFSCVGTDLVVISEDSESLHYAPLADVLNGTETWTEVTTGFVTGNGPLAMISVTALHTWIVGENGYIYFTADPTSGVSVLDAGVATTENLTAIHALDTENLVAVGANNAVVLTRDGGSTWSSVTGPNAGTALNTVWMRGKDQWLVGDAGGQLWYTLDAGVNWTEKTFPGSGSGSVRHIVFSSPSVGYLAHSTTAPAGRILRTINGGFSWYVLPEASGFSIPANDYVAKLAPCENEVNLIYGGGLAGNETDGFLVKASAAL
jgi:photosystem II stability/assembly factor-like uncharacterized protein